MSAYVVDGLEEGSGEADPRYGDQPVQRFLTHGAGTARRPARELENRKLVDRAKGILMKSRGLSEDEAYALLRKTAMNQNRKISDIAQSLVTAAGLLGPGDDA